MSGLPRFLILGGGAIGSVVAAALSERCPGRVVLIGRRDHVAAVAGPGLVLEGFREGHWVIPAAEAVTAPLEETLVVVTVKAFDLAGALRSLGPWLRPSSAVWCLQNGYGIRNVAREALAGTPVDGKGIHRGIVALGATFLAPGRVRFLGGNIRAEASLAETVWIDDLRRLFIPVTLSQAIERDAWTKLLVNSVVNPLSLLLRADNRTLTDPRFDPLKEAILGEGRAVAAAEGFPTPVDAPFVNRFITSDNRSSMLQDFLAGRQTELEFLNGALVRLGEKYGLATPVNRTVAELVRAALAVRDAGKTVK